MKKSKIVYPKSVTYPTLQNDGRYKIKTLLFCDWMKIQYKKSEQNG